MYVNTYLSVLTYLCIYLSIYPCIHAYMHACKQAGRHAYRNTYMYTCNYVRVSTNIHISLSLYIYISLHILFYTYLHRCTYTYTKHMHRCIARTFWELAFCRCAGPALHASSARRSSNSCPCLSSGAAVFLSMTTDRFWSHALEIAIVSHTSFCCQGAFQKEAGHSNNVLHEPLLEPLRAHQGASLGA